MVLDDSAKAARNKAAAAGLRQMFAVQTTRMDESMVHAMNKGARSITHTRPLLAPTFALP